MTTLGQRINNRQFAIICGLVVALVVLPLAAGSYVIYLATYVLILAIAASGYNIAFGYTGMISLGHSIFFGFGAYTVGILGRSLSVISSGVLLLLAAIVVGAVLGAFVGFCASFVRGIYVVLVTLIFAEIAYLIIWLDPWGVTWGESGIVGIRPDPMSLGGWEINVFRGVGLYYFVVGILVCTILVVKGISSAQLGAVFQGIRENEDRVSALGFHVRAYKVLSFVISAAICSVAGFLVAALDNSATAATVQWTLGAEILLICLVGGSRSLWGPVLGAVVVGFVKYGLSSFVGGGASVYVLGALYIVVMMWMRGGITSTGVAKAVGAFGRRSLWSGSSQ